MFQHSVPDTKVSSTSDSVVRIMVIRVGSPEGSRCNVIIEKTGAGFYKQSQVVLKHKISFFKIII